MKEPAILAIDSAVFETGSGLSANEAHDEASDSE